MKYLVTTKETQGQRKNDFCFVEEGEVVLIPVDRCDKDRGNPDGPCGCWRSWVGVTSRKGTTTAKVVDDPEMTEERMLNILVDYLTAYFSYLPAPMEVIPKETEVYYEQIQWMLDIIKDTPEGTVVELRGDYIYARRRS